MIPLATPNLDGNEGAYLQECVTSTFVSSVGRFVSEFEEKVAAEAGAAGGVATSSGTNALHLALAALRVGPGDLVVLPTYTFIASANAIAMAGARPWLMDVTAETWTLDPAQLADQLDGQTETRDGRLVHRATGERVAAVMPVDTLGHPADMDAIADGHALMDAHRQPDADAHQYAHPYLDAVTHIDDDRHAHAHQFAHHHPDAQSHAHAGAPVPLDRRRADGHLHARTGHAQLADCAHTGNRPKHGRH